MKLVAVSFPRSRLAMSIASDLIEEMDACWHAGRARRGQWGSALGVLLTLAGCSGTAGGPAPTPPIPSTSPPNTTPPPTPVPEPAPTSPPPGADAGGAPAPNPAPPTGDAGPPPAPSAL